MFVQCQAIETDFANQTTAAAIVTVPTSKPINAIIGNSTNPNALFRDGPASRIQNARRVRVVRSEENREKMVADAVACEPVSTVKFPANREKSREFYKIAVLAA